eukprot:TRINITY_DN8165_c0_g1_i2.p1 TRINITY_DN8165_c0_g1~~TRINITY_DN8165_c0_g1_i2.p1  ORF type:complete len:1783 (+),score=651.09 TRINITY_DN8165_c0_g1_i2:157-5505(+)
MAEPAVAQRRATVDRLDERFARRQSRGLTASFIGLAPRWDVCGDNFLVSGKGKDGQLGTGTDKALRSFTLVEPPHPDPLPDNCRPELAALEGVRSVACGLDFTVALMHDGRLIATGKNEHGQLGLGDTENRDTWHEVPGFDDEGVWIKSVHCGASHCMVLLSDGTLRAAGCNLDGRLGLGSDDHAVCSYTEVPLQNITGEDGHTVVITAAGVVFAAGKNDGGQLGLGHSISQTRFQKCHTIAKKAEAVRCGGEHTFIICSDGSVHAAGKNDVGQLGLPEKGYESFTPVEELGAGIQDIVCGQDFSFVVMRDDMVFACGRNDVGQLGLGNIDPAVTRWTMVDSLFGHEVAQISCGRNHAVVLTVKREVLCSGASSFGQLGLPDEVDGVDVSRRCLSFTIVEDLLDEELVNSLAPIVMIAAGGDHSVLVTGHLGTCGRDVPPANFEPLNEVWDTTAETSLEARNYRIEQLVEEGLADHALVLREEENERELARRHFGWEAAVYQRLNLLVWVEEMEREAAESDEHGDRASLAMVINEYHFICHRFYETCMVAEDTERSAVVLEEEGTWQTGIGAFLSQGACMVAQYDTRLETMMSETRQREALHRDQIRANHYEEHQRYTQIYHDATDRLRWTLVEADRVRAIPLVLPLPTELLRTLQPALAWEKDIAPLRRGASLDQAREIVATTYSELLVKAHAARGGEVKAVARRDYALVQLRTACEQWVNELNTESVARTCLRGDRNGGWDPPAGDWGPPGRHDELSAWARNLARQIAERGGAPEGVRRPGDHESGCDALRASAEEVRNVNALVEAWQREYSVRVAEAQVATDQQRLVCFNLFSIPLRPWIPQFDELDRRIRAEERLKALQQGVSPQPEVEVARVAAGLLLALERVDGQLREVAAERVDAGRHFELSTHTMEAQRRLEDLRKTISKENRRRAGLNALRQALEFGALSEDDFERQRKYLEPPSDLPRVPSQRGLWELREDLRRHKAAVEQAEDRVKRTGLYKDEGERDQVLPEHWKAVEAAAGALREVKRRLHAEQALVKKQLDTVWKIVWPYVTDTIEEIRRLNGSELAKELAATQIGQLALPLVVDRRRGEYEFEDHPEWLDSRGRQRLLWARFDGAPVVLKEYRIEEVYGGLEPVLGLRAFAKWLGTCAAMRHSSIAGMRCLFGEIDDDESEVFYLQFDRYDTDLRKWMKRPRDGTPEEQAHLVLHIMQSLFSALAFLHTEREDLPQGVVHGNIGASNILMKGDHPLLNDIEPLQEQPPQKGEKKRPLEMRGTVPAYVAPELVLPGTAVRNDRLVTPNSDVYALGRTFEELLACGCAAGLREMDAQRGGQKLHAALAQLCGKMANTDVSLRPSAAAAAMEFGALTRGWDPKLQNNYEAVVSVERKQDQVSAFLQELLSTNPMVWLHNAPPPTDECGMERVRFTIERFGQVVEKVPDAAESARNQVRWEMDKKRSEEEFALLDAQLNDLRYRAASSEMRCPDYWRTREVDGARAPLFPLGPAPGAELEVPHVGWHNNRRMVEMIKDEFQRLTQGKEVRLTLRHAWRSENHTLWRMYANVRQETRVLRTKQAIPMDVPRRTKLDEKLREAARRLAGVLDEHVNETYLWCPVQACEVLSVLAYGLKVSFNPGRYGYCITLYENPAACDAETHSADTADGAVPELHSRLYRSGVKHPGECCYMLLCRVTLGRICPSEDGLMNMEDRKPIHEAPRPFQGPKQDTICWATDLCYIPGKDEVARYHSLVVEPHKASGRPWRSVSIYDRCRIMPEYLVAYTRDSSL